MARKKKAKRPYATCLSCGANLRKSQKACTACGRANMARNEAVKASIGAALLAKSAGASPGYQMADDARRERLIRDMYRSPDPAYREAAWRSAHPWLYGSGGTAS